MRTHPRIRRRVAAPVRAEPSVRAGTMARVSHAVAVRSQGMMGPVNQRTVTLLGSTGSIGTQAIDVLRRNPERFRVLGLSAGGANSALLMEQAELLGVETVAVADERAAAELRATLAAPGPGHRDRLH